MKSYRALISIPLEAESDEEALRVANEAAGSLGHPNGAVAGHMELVGEVREDLIEVARVVHIDAAFLRQLPSDWK